ncbi:hypothetical protein Tco_0541203, partial [Tanacetum coccineum]
MVVQVQKFMIMQVKLEGEEKKDAEDQEQDENVNSTNNINTVSLIVNTASTKDNTVDENIVIRCADGPNMPNLEEIFCSNNDEGV